MMTESKLSKIVHQNLKDYCYDHHLAMKYQRIESPSTGDGIPDAYACVNSKPFWIEYKIEKNPLSNFQIAWHHTHNAAGGKTFVIRWLQENFIIIENWLQTSYAYIRCSEDNVGQKLIECL